MATTAKRLTVLGNSFHATEYRTRKAEADVDRLRMADPDRLDDADRAWIRRVRRALCGIEGCTCATTQLGER